jgi:hypothetical protein
MTRRSKAVLTVLALAALPLPAAAQEMCAALNRIAAAANEPVPFASLENNAGSLVPGYRYCRVETQTARRAGNVLCHAQLAPKSLIAEHVGAQVQDCLGGTAVPQEWPDNDRVYRTANLVITVESRCDERCHVGRIASMRVVRRREGEGRPAR